MQLNQTEIKNIFEITKIITLFTDQILPSRACKEELYDFWQMIYIFKGVRSIKIEDITHRLIDGQVLFYPPNIPHNSIQSMNTVSEIGIISFICPSIYMDFFKHREFSLKSKEKILISNILKQGSSLFKWYESDKNHVGMYAENPSPAELYRLKLNIEMFLTILYTEYSDTAKVDFITSKKRNQNKEIIKLIIDYMEKNLNYNLTVEQLSKTCGLSVSSLKNIFREETGSGVINFFNNLKIQKAMDLIRNSSLSFSQISEQLNFSSPFYFSRMFKKITNLTPMEYSKSICKINKN